MAFNKLRTYIIERLLQKEAESNINFENVFADILHHNTTHEEGLILLITLVPHVLPHFFDDIIKEIFPEGLELPEMGGVRDGNHRGFLPTGETIQYVLAKDNIAQRLLLCSYFEHTHWFNHHKILRLESVKDGIPMMSGRIIMDASVVHLLLFGKSYIPSFGPDFPLQEVQTLLEWKDLTISKQVENQIHLIKLWIQHHKSLHADENLKRFVNKGYRALFHGPPGTGKTLTASLIGKTYNMPVFRIDLSQVSSKYIGETEKNLEKIFQIAELKNWILIFDEADALFAKRTQVKSSNDRYANQEVSFLLQRIENYDGLIILTSNFKNNMDAAFLRRFNSIIKFSIPTAEERLIIWKKAKPQALSWNSAIIKKLSGAYELTAAQIVNVITYAALKTYDTPNTEISENNLLEGIALEFEKDDRIFQA